MALLFTRQPTAACHVSTIIISCFCPAREYVAPKGECHSHPISRLFIHSKGSSAASSALFKTGDEKQPASVQKAPSHETLPMRGCFDSERAPLPSRNALLFIFSSTKKASTVIGTGFQAGDPREIRTPDTLIRSQVLYPAELLGHVAGAEGLKPPTYGFGDRCSINCAMPLSV